jgi:hypothetical protein
MTIRRAAASALLLAVASCTPSIPQDPSPASVVTAIFDPAAGDIPLPSDLVLLDPSTLNLPAAQKELLTLFKTQGGFPNDQEVAVTISFARDQINADGSTTRVAPILDRSSFTPNTFFVFGVTSGGAVMGEIPLDPIGPGDVAVGPAAGGHGTVTTLTLHNKGRQPWAPGRYAVLVRGGPSGVKTVEADAIWPSSVFYLVAQGKDMTAPANLVLLKAQAGSYAAAVALAEQLNMMSTAFAPAFAACDQRFPHQELASLVGFSIAPAQTQVDLDPGRGLVPLPVDLLRDPRPASATCAACGKLTPLAACTLAQGTFNAAVGTCSSAAAGGFAALDGFSTTAPLLAPTNDLVLASTVTSASYKLYDLTNPIAPVLVDPATYLIEPAEFTSSGLSPVVASQPVGATATDPTSPFRTRPLKDDTNYAVVITKAVKDKTGKALGRGTVGSVLLFDNPLVNATGVSQLLGIDNLTAGALEVMRQRLLPVRAALAAASPAVTRADIAMAYTFKTQSFKKQAAQLGALPYTMAAATGLSGPVTSLTAAAAFAKYGVDGAVVPSSHIAEVLETTITTFNLLDPATGAFHAGAPAEETIKVLITVPFASNPAVPACTGALAAAGLPFCAPMMVFRHGLGGGRAHMLTVADTYAAKGMVTVAIDAAKSGDRSFCTQGVATVSAGGATYPVCTNGAACVSTLPAGAQGDAHPPGTCAAGFTKMPVSLSCAAPAACGYAGADGIPLVSANFIVTSNFFRTRDTFRQDIIDQSQLIRAIAFAPSAAAPPTAHPVFAHMMTSGLVIDPAAIYYSGQSMGAIQGTVNVAANPRITRAALNVGGGTLVDTFTTSPAFANDINALLAGMGIARGSSSYLQFLAVAKLIIDPADPINYAGNLTANTLPNLLPPLGGAIDGSVAQAPKRILTQVALCDQTVPNTWNYVWASNVGSSPLPVAPNFGVPGTFQLYAMQDGVAPASLQAAIGAAVQTCGVPGATSPHAVKHAFFTDWTFSSGATLRAQEDAADFVLSATHLPASLVVIP